MQAQLIDLLIASKVRAVLDIRAIAASRKAGFSKTLLAAGLHSAGIAYRHDRRLGTPKAGRQAARAGKPAVMTAIFEAHMQQPDPLAGLIEAAAGAQASRVCLLCYEQAPHACHRSIIATMIRERTGQDIRHL